MVYNNVWNAGVIRDYEQCVMRRVVDGEIEFGWRWSWPYARVHRVAPLIAEYHAANHYVRAFPEIYYGSKPWNPSTTARMPMRLSEMRELHVDFDAYLTVKGDYNLAFNSWFTTDNPATEAGIEAEIMVWIDRTDWTPQGSGHLVANVVIDEREYSLYVRRVYHTLPNRGHTYLAFAAHDDQFSGRLDLKKFIEFLVNDGLLSDDLWISGVEMGNEVLDGTGELWLKEFRVHAR